MIPSSLTALNFLARKQRLGWFLVVLVLLLSACAHAEGETLTPIDPEAWPTPEPISVQATATTFPRLSAEAAATLDPPPPAPPTEEVPAEADFDISDPAPVEPEAPTATPSPTEALAEASPTPSPTVEEETVEEESAPADEGLTATIASYALNLRDAPGLEAEVITQLTRQDALSITEADGPTGWVRVTTDSDLSGWVNPKYLTINGDLGSLANSERALERAAEEWTLPPAPGGVLTETQSSTSQPGPVSGQANGEQLLVQLISGGDIVLLNRDGSEMRVLTQGIDPRLSPDGRQVAFTRWDDNTGGSLWVMNVDGTGEQRILGDMRKVKSPSWSPDSQRVAVNFQRGGTLDAERICHDVSEGEPDINFWVAYDIEQEVRIDPDAPGGFRVFICWTLPPDPHWQMRIINVSDGSFEDMPAGQYAFAPAWDPVREWRVVSTAGLGLVETDINQGEASRLTEDPADRGPVFSPNGEFLAVSYWQHDHWSVHRLNADGTNRERLTRTPFYARVGDNESAAWNNASPVFAPDSDEIAFLTDRTGVWEVWVMNLDGSNQRPMFSEAVNAQLEITYTGNDERALDWSR